MCKTIKKILHVFEKYYIQSCINTKKKLLLTASACESHFSVSIVAFWIPNRRV